MSWWLSSVTVPASPLEAVFPPFSSNQTFCLQNEKIIYFIYFIRYIKNDVVLIHEFFVIVSLIFMVFY